MPARESEAIILRSFPLGEGDRLVSFLSRSEGRLRGVAAGARKPKSRFSSSLEPLSYIRIWYFEKETRELVRISQCEIIESFWDAQLDYVASLVMALASEVTEATLGEREVADANFRLLLLFARYIKSGGDLQIALAYFALWTVRLGGWLPNFDHCAKCGARLQGNAHISDRDGLLCDACNLSGQREISRVALSIGQKMLSTSLEQFKKDDAAQDSAISELKDYMLDVIEQHAEKRLHTRRLLRESAETLP
jgi:DNA repair protein RecO (recombination protein O)